MTPAEAYREGYEKGRRDKFIGHIGQIMDGLIDDPGGHRAAGYRDGAARAKFNPPSPYVTAPKENIKARAGASDLEKAWWALCHGSEFIAPEIADYYADSLRAAGKTASYLVGLSSFAETRCQRCSMD